jgi:hypothetical protein
LALLSGVAIADHERGQKAVHALAANPQHPSLQFKKVGRFWSARITDDFRALAHLKGDTYHWVWIGTHAEYDRMIENK